MAARVYILRCADDRLYFGSTTDLIRRLAEHRRGHVRTTARRLPLTRRSRVKGLPVRLLYFEEHATPDQARQREHQFKNGHTRRKTIELLIADFPAQRLAPFA